jgi:hypothetical protein
MGGLVTRSCAGRRWRRSKMQSGMGTRWWRSILTRRCTFHGCCGPGARLSVGITVTLDVRDAERSVRAYGGAGTRRSEHRCWSAPATGPARPSASRGAFHGARPMTTMVNRRRVRLLPSLPIPVGCSRDHVTRAVWQIPDRLGSRGRSVSGRQHRRSEQDNSRDVASHRRSRAAPVATFANVLPWLRGLPVIGASRLTVALSTEDVSRSTSGGKLSSATVTLRVGVTNHGRSEIRRARVNVLVPATISISASDGFGHGAPAGTRGERLPNTSEQIKLVSIGSG